MDIYRAEKIAQEMVENGADPETIKFRIVGPRGERSASWLDPHMGLLRIDGMDGFVMVRDISDPVLRIEDMGIVRAA